MTRGLGLFFIFCLLLWCGTCWERINSTVAWRVSGLDRAATAPNVFGEQLGFKITTADFSNRVDGGRDLCAIAKGVNQVRCWYFDPAKPFGYREDGNSDYVWTSTSCSTWDNDCSCGRRYYPIAITAGRLSSSSYDDIVFIGANTIESAERTLSSSDLRPFAYVWRIAGDGAGGLVSYSSDCCPRLGPINVQSLHGTPLGLLVDKVYGSAEVNQILYSIAFHLQSGQLNDPDGCAPSDCQGNPGIFRVYRGSDLASQGSTRGWYFDWNQQRGVGYNNNGFTITSSRWFSTNYKGTHADIFTAAPLAFENDMMFGQGVVLGYHAGASIWNRYTPFAVIVGAQVIEEFGYFMISGGDVNGDGYEDLVISAPSYCSEDVSDIGRIVIIFGSSAFAGIPGSPTMIETGDFDALFASGVGQVVVNPSLAGAKSARFGMSAIFMPDMNSDGYDELLVGSPGHNGWRGRVYMFHGCATGIDPSPAWIKDSDFSSREMFGHSLAVADLNLDGYYDVIVAGYGEYGDAGHISVYTTNPNAKMNITVEAPFAPNYVAGSSVFLNVTVGSFGPETVANLSVSIFGQGKFIPFNMTESNLVCSFPSTFPTSTDIGWEIKCFATSFASLDTASVLIAVDTMCDLPEGEYQFDVSLSAGDVMLAGVTSRSLVMNWQNIASITRVSAYQLTSSLRAGEANEYVTTWRNDGPSCVVALGVLVDFAPLVDRGLVYMASSFSIGSCSQTSNGGEEELLCTPVGTVSPGTEMTLSVEVVVDASFRGSLANFTAVLSSGSKSLSSPLEMISMNETSVSRLSTLYLGAFDKSPDIPFLIVGSPVKYSLGALVSGPSSTLDNSLVFNLPVNCTYFSVIVTGGGGDPGRIAQYGGVNFYPGNCKVTSPSPDDVTREILNCTIPALPPTLSGGYLIEMSAQISGEYASNAVDVWVNASSVTPAQVVQTSYELYRNLSYNVVVELDLYIFLSKSCPYTLCTPRSEVRYSVEVVNDGPSAGLNPHFELEYPENFTLLGLPAPSGPLSCTHNESIRLIECFYSGFLQALHYMPTSKFLFDVANDWNLSVQALAKSQVYSSPGYTDIDDKNDAHWNIFDIFADSADLFLDSVLCYVPGNSSFEKLEPFTWNSISYDAMMYPSGTSWSANAMQGWISSEQQFEIAIGFGNNGPNYGFGSLYVAVDDKCVLYETRNATVIQVPDSKRPPPFISISADPIPDLSSVTSMEPFNRSDVYIFRVDLSKLTILSAEVRIGRFFVFEDIKQGDVLPGPSVWAAVICDDIDKDLSNNNVSRTDFEINPVIVPPPPPEAGEGAVMSPVATGFSLFGILVLCSLIVALLCCFASCQILCFVATALFVGQARHFHERRQQKRKIRIRGASRAHILAKVEGSEDGLDDSVYEEDESSDDESSDDMSEESD